MENVYNAKNLYELCEALENLTEDDFVDTSCLPTFGGEEPTDTEGIYSWDEDSLLVSDGNGDWSIISRPDDEDDDDEDE